MSLGFNEPECRRVGCPPKDGRNSERGSMTDCSSPSFVGRSCCQDGLFDHGPPPCPFDSKTLYVLPSPRKRTLSALLFSPPAKSARTDVKPPPRVSSMPANVSAP